MKSLKKKVKKVIYQSTGTCFPKKSEEVRIERLETLVIMLAGKIDNLRETKADKNSTYTPMFREKSTIIMPREVLMKRMIDIIVDKLGVEESEVVENASFSNDLGADSLDAIELMVEFEKEFNVVVSDEVAERVETLKDAIDALYELINGK